MKKINLEEIFISALGSDKKLKWYLQYDINVVNYLDQTKTQLMAFFDIAMAFISKEKKLEMIGDLSAERILKILQQERADLYKILINHPRGRIWMNNQIKFFKKRFL